MRTIRKRYDELVPGDRVVLPYSGLVRTVSGTAPNGYVNHRDEPLWNVYYAEGRTDEWSGGNSGLPSSTCVVLIAPSVPSEPF